jgi:hypothetical protein
MKNIIRQAVVKSGFCKLKLTADSGNTRTDAHCMFDISNQAMYCGNFADMASPDLQGG